MLSVAEEYLRELNPDARLEVFGQDYNAAGLRHLRLRHDDQGPGHRQHRASATASPTTASPGSEFDYMLANPPFGVKWKAQQDFVKREHEEQGFGGRFGAGPAAHQRRLAAVPAAHDQQDEGPEGRRHAPRHRLQRLAALHRVAPAPARARSAAGSSRTTGSRPSSPCPTSSSTTPASTPTSGSSPTGRREQRRGKVQLINAAGFFKKMRKSLGNKRNEICEPQRDEITRLYGEFEEGEHVRIFDNEDFGYRRITVERPLRLNFAATPERLARARGGLGLPGTGDEQEAQGQEGRRGRDRRRPQAAAGDPPGAEAPRRRGRRQEPRRLHREGRRRPSSEPASRSRQRCSARS